MPQTQYQLDTTLNKEQATELREKTSNLQGVKFVNVNVDGKSVVVTHDDSYDEGAFKSAAGI